MTLVRWEPVRLFTTFFDNPTTAPRTGAPVRNWYPPMDLVQTEDHFVVRADLPGLAPDDVCIELADNVLTIAGERAPVADGGEGYLRVERVAGSFQRSLTLPDGVDGDAIAASFENGVLEVRVPKPEQRKPRRVAIQVGGALQPAIEGSESQ